MVRFGGGPVEGSVEGDVATVGMETMPTASARMMVALDVFTRASVRRLGCTWAVVLGVPICL